MAEIANPSLDDKIKLYKFFSNLIGQGILLTCSQVAFFWILSYLLSSSAASDAKVITLSILEVILQGTVFFVYKYYFYIQKPKE